MKSNSVLATRAHRYSLHFYLAFSYHISQKRNLYLNSQKVNMLEDRLLGSYRPDDAVRQRLVRRPRLPRQRQHQKRPADPSAPIVLQSPRHPRRRLRPTPLDGSHPRRQTPRPKRKDPKRPSRILRPRHPGDGRDLRSARTGGWILQLSSKY